MRYVSKQTLDEIAAEHPEMLWYCGPIGKDSEFELPPGTIAACIQMLEEPHPGEQVTTQEGSYFAVAPRMDSATHLEWLRNNYEESPGRQEIVYSFYHNLQTADGLRLDGVLADTMMEDAIKMHEEEDGKAIQLEIVLMRNNDIFYHRGQPISERVTLIEARTLRGKVLDQVRTILSGIPEDTGLTADEVRLEVAERIVEGFPKGIQPDVDIDLAQAANLINEAGTYLGGTLHPDK